MNATLKKAFVHSTPVFFAFIFLGIGYGMLMEQNGYNFIWTFFISLFTFAGSAQFAMVAFLTSQMNPFYVFLFVFVINARHIFYGISMSSEYLKYKYEKFYLFFGLTDETFTVINAHEDDILDQPKKYYLYITLLHQIYWVTGSVIGGLLGSILPFEIIGLDFILFALFLSVYVSQLKKAKNKIPGFLGIGLSLLALLVLKSQFVILSMVLIIISLLFYEKTYRKKVSL